MTYDISTLPMNLNKCRTCPFTQTSPTAIALQNRIIKRMIGDGGSQVCHGTEGQGGEPKSFCKGAKEQILTLLYQLGFIDEVTDKAWVWGLVF